MIDSKEQLERATAALEDFINKFEKKKKDLGVKSSSIRIMREAVSSFKDDIARCNAGVTTDDDLAAHYEQNNFLSIVYSKLSGKKPGEQGFYCAISDVEGYELIDSKDSLIASMQKKRDQELNYLTFLNA